MVELIESYVDFAEQVRNIRFYGNWHYTSKKALMDLNEWLKMDNLGPVTRAEMKQLEKGYLKMLKEKDSKWVRYTGYCNYSITDKEFWEIRKAIKGWDGEYKAVIRVCSLVPLRFELVAYKKATRESSL